jgi:DNA repair photolyase
MGEQIANIPSQTLFPILPSGSAPSLRGIARAAAETEVVRTGHHVEFRALPVRSILNKTISRRGLPFARSINPYRGCVFGCQYCYARYTHEFMELRDPRSFEQRIFLKQNAAWLLQQELRTLQPGESIAIGTATDPYQPVERHARITRSLLEVLAGQRGLRLGIITKSTLIVRDIDLLQAIAARNSLTLNLTITTMDTRLARILEPQAPRPDLRMEAVRKLRAAGLTVGVLCCPLLPGITDTQPALDSVARAAKAADALFLHASALFLKPCSKPVFEAFIAENFPHLLGQYQQRFADRAFVTTAYRKRLQELLRTIHAKYGWTRNFDSRAVSAEPAPASGQMELAFYPSERKPARPAQASRERDLERRPGLLHR